MPSRDQRAATSARPGNVSRQQARVARAKLAAGGLSHQEQRRLRSTSRARDRVARRRGLEARHTGLALIGGVVAMAVVAVAFALGPAIDAARGQGTDGIFTADYLSCSVRVGCQWVGTFQSPAGEVLPDVAYNGSLPDGARPGMSVPAIYTGASHRVYAPHGSHVWLFDLLLVVFVGCAVAAALWISPIGLRKQEM